MQYETIIGLEIHVQLKTKSKMFCSCPNEAEPKEPNINICPICMGHPGVLPVINSQAVEWTIMAGQALHCRINKQAKFDRKNYFYPDLPKGYQISQYDQPFCGAGYLEIEIGGQKRKISLERIHLEEDAGKLIHPEGANYSLVDYNRASTPLMEIVTKPDIRSPEEAKIFLQTLRKILKYIGVSDADMEKGQLRCDANISLREKGAKTLLPKTEVKNMNSFKAVEKALAYEQNRQADVLDEGGELYQATRGWDENKGETIEQRVKEGEADYRYFPEPDLPPLEFSDAKIAQIFKNLPELPEDRKNRFMEQFEINGNDAEILIQEREVGEYFEAVISESKEWVQSLKGENKEISTEAKEIIKLATNWIITRLFALLKEKNISLADCKITPENFAELMAMIAHKKISAQNAVKVLKIMFDHGSDPSQVIDEQGLAQVSDEGELNKIIAQVIIANPYSVKDFQAGKKQALQFLIGQVMAATKGKADPKTAGEMLKAKIEQI